MCESLAQYLRDNVDVLMDRWREQARRDPTQPACRHHLSDRELDDHLPSLLAMLADTFSNVATTEIEAEGAKHGHQRRMLNYTVGEVLGELHTFREVILDAVDRFNLASDGRGADQQASIRRRLLRLLDRSFTASVERYVHEAERAREVAEQRLEQKNRALELADAQKDRFFTILSHELRNPLSPILIAAEVLQRLGPNDPTLVKQRDIIRRQTRHLTKLVDDLLDVNRIARGKIDFNPRIVDFQDSVGLALETCRPLIAANELALALEIADGSFCVFADPTRLGQVVTNLLTNAAKFTPAGGRIRVTLTRENREAVLTVADTGIGISAELLPHIFELFTQADTPLHRVTGGLGVGLMVAKNLVEMQGGRIEARSEGQGTGTQMIVRFPLSLTAASGAHAAPRCDVDGVSRQRRVLLVEDEPDARNALGAALSLLGHQVFVAATGEDALNVARREQIDTYIIDIGLPGMNGFETATALRMLPAARRARLIALTGYGTDTDRARALEVGFDAHITKPVDVERLAAQLRG